MNSKLKPRMHRRIPVRFDALLLTGESNYKTLIYEIGQGGCLIGTPAPIEDGAEVTIASTFGMAEDRMLRGEVRYTVPLEEDGSHPYAVGLQFLPFEHDEESFLVKVIRAHRFSRFRSGGVKKIP